MHILTLVFLLGTMGISQGGVKKPVIKGTRSAHLSEEFMLDTSKIKVAHPWGSQVMPSISYSSGKFFAVWADPRGNSGIRYTLLDQNGALLDSFGIELPTLSGYVFDGIEGVASFGKYFEVMWEVVWGEWYGNDHVGCNAIVDTSGDVVSSFFYWFGEEFSGDLCSFNGKFAMIYFRGFPDLFRIEFRDTLGTLLFAKEITPDSLGLTGLGAPTIAFSGEDFLVAFARHDTVYGFRLDTLGNILGGGVHVLTSPGGAPDLHFALSHYLLITIVGPSSNKDIYGNIITPDLSYISDRFPIVTAEASQIEPTISATNDFYVVAWNDGRGGIYAARIDTTGTVLDPDGFFVTGGPGSGGHPGLALKDTSFLMALTSHGDVYTIPLDYNAHPTDTVWSPLTYGYNFHECTRVSTDGSNYMAVWMEMDSDNWDIKGALFSPCGIDLGHFSISAGSWDEKNPDITFNGENFFVVWQDKRSGDYDIYGARVSREGVLIDTFGIVLVSDAGNQVLPRVASKGEVYQTNPHNCIVGFVDGSDINYILVSSSGNPFVTPTTLGQGERLDVAAGASNYLVAWEEEFYVTYERRVDPSGNPIDPSPVQVIWGFYPEVSYYPSNPWESYYLVTAEVAPVCNYSTIEAVQVTEQSGEVGEEVTVAGTGNWGDWREHPCVSLIDATDFSIFWKHGVIEGRTYPSLGDVFGVSEVPDPDWPDVIAGPRDWYGILLDEGMVVYEGSAQYPYDTRRVFGRMVQLTDSLPVAPIMDDEPPVTPGDSNTVSWSMPYPWGEYHPAYEYYVECATDSNFNNVVANSGWIAGRFFSGSYTFASLSPGVTYYYRVKGRNLLGEGPWSNTVWSTQEGPGEVFESEIPFETRISLISSNPSPGEVVLEVTVPGERKGEIVIYDCTGRFIKRLFSGKIKRGVYRFVWKGLDENGNRVGSGIYFLKHKLGEKKGIEKIILMR